MGHSIKSGPIDGMQLVERWRAKIARLAIQLDVSTIKSQAPETTTIAVGTAIWDKFLMHTHIAETELAIDGNDEFLHISKTISLYPKGYYIMMQAPFRFAKIQFFYYIDNYYFG